MLEVREVCKRFGDRVALRDVSFKVAPGEVFGVLGLNGSGKTTLLRLLAGYFAADSGAIYLDKEVVEPGQCPRGCIAYLPEDSALYGDMTVRDYLRFRARLKGLSGQRVDSSIAEVLEQVELPGRVSSLISQLSKGMARRVGVADAFLGMPRVIVLDEPSSGLDVAQRQRLSKTLVPTSQQSVVISSHTMDIVAALADRILILDDGVISYLGTQQQLRVQLGLDAGVSLEQAFLRMQAANA